jgi:hypothetical protein
VTTSESNGAAGAPDEAEADYVAARLANDYLRCVTELLDMTVWLPLKGAAGRFLLTRRGDQRLIRAYTSRGRLDAVAEPDVDPAAASVRGFAELVAAWRHPEIGLVINPDSESEFQIPRRLFDRVLQIQQRGLSGEAAEAVERARRRLARSLDTPEEPPQPVRVAPIEPPNEIAGFRFATMVDGLDEHGTPRIDPERGRVENPDEKRRIQRYLRGGEMLLLVTGYVTDMLDASRGAVVPASTRTDGEWIWSEGLEYYLEEYGVAPEPDFYRAIVAAGYTCPDVTEERVRTAAQALQERQRIAGEMYQRWQAEQG